MPNDRELIGKLFSTIHRYSMIYVSRSFKKFGIGAGQRGVFGVLYQNDGISQDELAQKLNMSKATIARAVQKLERLGYVTRQSDPEDRRVKLVYLFPRAHEVRPQIQTALKEWTEILLQGFTEQESEMLLWAC